MWRRNGRNARRDNGAISIDLLPGSGEKRIALWEASDIVADIQQAYDLSVAA